MDAATALRAQLGAFTDEDLARLVLAAVIGLDDLEMAPELANLMQMTDAELEHWVQRVVHGEPGGHCLDGLSSEVLGLFEPVIEDTGQGEPCV